MIAVHNTIAEARDEAIQLGHGMDERERGVKQYIETQGKYRDRSLTFKKMFEILEKDGKPHVFVIHTGSIMAFKTLRVVPGHKKVQIMAHCGPNSFRVIDKETEKSEVMRNIGKAIEKQCFFYVKPVTTRGDIENLPSIILDKSHTRQLLLPATSLSEQISGLEDLREYDLDDLPFNGS